MATAAEMESPTPTDTSRESGGGDEEMKQALPELESAPQNGGADDLLIAEPGGGGGGPGPEETAGTEGPQSVGHERPQDSSETGAAALPKGPGEPERPSRRSFQIPRKSREKKGGASPSPRPSFFFFFLKNLPISLFFSLPSFSFESLSPSSHTHPRHATAPAAPAATAVQLLLRSGRAGSGASTLCCSPCPRASLQVAQVGKT